MKGIKEQKVTVFIWTLFLIGIAEGEMRAPPGPDCWFLKKCQIDKPISSEGLSSVAFPTIEEQSLECHKKCVADSNCEFFTLQRFRNQGVCYLLTHCTENLDDYCLGHGTCKSGPKNCDPEKPNKHCPKIPEQNTWDGKIHWQCTDYNGNNINGYANADIPPYTSCILRCESWIDQTGNPGYLESICQDDGTWNKSMASDGNDELAFPAKPIDCKYPTPANVSDFKCQCQNLEIKWPYYSSHPEECLWYDPNKENGAHFICDDTINNGTGKFIIESGNNCLMFCDDHLVSTVRCLNGEWTGNPELGFWCFKAPKKECQHTSTVKENKQITTKKENLQISTEKENQQTSTKKNNQQTTTEKENKITSTEKENQRTSTTDSPK